MKKHTWVLSFITFVIVLGALPIVGGCQPRIRDGLNWWSQDYSNLKRTISYSGTFDFIVDDSITRIFDTGTIVWKRSNDTRYTEERHNGQIIREIKHGQWEYNRYGDWATYKINGYETLLLTLPSSELSDSILPTSDKEGFSLLAFLNDSFYDYKYHKFAEQYKVQQITVISPPEQPQGLKALGPLRYERWEISNSPKYSMMGLWILPAPQPTIMQIEYTDLKGKKWKEGLISWSPGLDRVEQTNIPTKSVSRNVCLVVYDSLNCALETTNDTHGIITALQNVESKITSSSSIEEIISSISLTQNIIRLDNEDHHNSDIKLINIRPPKLLLPEEINEPWWTLQVFLTGNIDARNTLFDFYEWNGSKPFIAITYGIPKTPSPTILFLQRKAKPEDKAEWTLREEAVTINDGQVVKLLHLTGVKDSFYCDLIGHDATEAQLREMQAQLILCQPKNRNNELFPNK